MKSSTGDSTIATGALSNSGAVFVTTHWSVVVAAGRSETPRARAALEQLCRNYWHPLYYYVRRQGVPPDDAQDLTQAFFAIFLSRNSIATADPDRGRFRSFLLASLKNFLHDEWDKSRALKRGGGQVFTADFQDEEARVARELIDPISPDKAYARRWALLLLEHVYRRLEEEAQQQGRTAQFNILRVALMGNSDAAPYAELAARLGTTEGAMRVAVHRLRQRYREVLRELIADTVSSPGEVEAEFQYLREALSN